MRYEFKEPWITIVAIISIILAFLVFTKFFSKEDSLVQPDVNPVVNSEIIKQEKTVTLSEFEEYLSYIKFDVYPSGLVTPLKLIETCEDKKKNPELCNKEIAKITKVFRVVENPKKAYLYIKAGVSRGSEPIRTLTEYDSIWFFIDSSDFGGHILRDYKEGVIFNRVSEEGYTELLFDLSKIPMTNLPYNPNAQPSKVVNITDNVFSIKGKHYIASFVSTKGYGKIFELKIGYDNGLLEVEL